MELNFNLIEKVQLSDFMIFSSYLEIDTAFIGLEIIVYLKFGWVLMCCSSIVFGFGWDPVNLLKRSRRPCG